jgi:ferredoxin/flavodoxin
VSQTIAICYFSGTGNTEYVVGLASDAFSNAGVDVTLIRIEDLRRAKSGEFDPTSYDMLGIAHPVLGFGCPGLVSDFVRSLPPMCDKPVFVLKTAGDFHSINHSASYSIGRILSAKGYDLFYDEIVAMPSNWLVAYDDQLNRQLVEEAPKRVEAAVRRILAGERRSLSNGWPSRIVLSAIGYLEEHHGARVFGRDLRAGESCTLCGRCARDCPKSNIRVTSDGVVFGDACVWCMRCIYNCPQRAIDTRYMNAFILKGGYSLARVRELPCVPIDHESSRPSFWHKYFRRYFDE